MAINVSVPSTRIKGLMRSFENIFRNRINTDPDRKKLSAGLMDFIPSKNNAREETFFFLTDPPPFERWDEGEPRSLGTFGDQSWTVPIDKWQAGVQWKRLDEEDDLTQGNLKKQARSTANKAQLVDIEVAFQILQGATDPKRLKTIPLAADGLSLFSSSRALFGANGNVVAGSGLTSVAKIHLDFFEVLGRLHNLRDTHNDLYHPSSVLDGEGITIIASDIHRQRFYEAFEATEIKSGNTTIPNVIKARWGGNITLWLTPRITSDDWFLSVNGMPEKPIFALERNDLGGLEQLYVDERVSDYCRNYDVRQIVYRMRKGYGVSLPLGIVKVDNTN